MKVFIVFILGIGIGVFVFFRYLKDKVPKSTVLSSQISLIPSPTISLTPTGLNYLISVLSETPFLSVTPSLSPTVMQLPSKDKTPTIGKASTPTRNLTPRITPTQEVSPIVSISPSISTLTSNTPSLTPTKAPVQTFSASETYSLYDRFAGQYGVDANVLRFIAKCESNFNALSVSRNRLYAGLYQFSGGAWSTYRKLIGEDPNPDLRLNAEEAIQTAAYILSIHKESIWPNCLPH